MKDIIHILTQNAFFILGKNILHAGISCKWRLNKLIDCFRYSTTIINYTAWAFPRVKKVSVIFLVHKHRIIMFLLCTTKVHFL